MATAPVKSANEWLKILTTPEQPDEVPAGFLTCKQISKLTGKAASTTRNLLSAALEEGRVEERKFKVRTGGKIYPVPHFKML